MLWKQKIAELGADDAASCGCIIVFYVSVNRVLAEGGLEKLQESKDAFYDFMNSIVNEIAEKMQSFFEEKGVAAEVLPCDQVHEVSLRKAAVDSGLGRIGKSNLLLTGRHGPRITLGGLLVKGEFEQETRVLEKDFCMECTACVEACPTGAIHELGLTPEKCTACYECALVCPVGEKIKEEYEEL